MKAINYEKPELIEIDLMDESASGFSEPPEPGPKEPDIWDDPEREPGEWWH